MQTSNKSNHAIKPSQWLPLVPVILLLGIAPLFIKYFPVSYPAVPVNWRLEPYMVADLFTYGKRGLILTAGVLSVVFLYFQINIHSLTNKANKPGFFLIFGTACWMLLTTLTAKFSYMAVWGAWEKYEGVLIWLTYLVFACYIGTLIKNESYKYWIFRIILFSGLLITGIGLTQFLSHDLIKMTWFKELIMPKEVADSANFVFEANRVYTTLYNPNFVAMYVATIFPLALFMTFKESKLYYKGLWAIYAVLLVINLMGSMSSGGFVGIALSAAVLAYIFIINKFSAKLQIILTSTVLAIAIVLFSLFTAGAFNNLLKIEPFVNRYQLTDIKAQDHQVAFTYKGKDLIVKTNPETLNTLRFYNSDGIELNVNTGADGVYSILNPDFGDITFTTGTTADGTGFVNFVIEGNNWIFLLHPNGMLYVNSMSTTVRIEKANALGGFVGHEQFGSARGYIWSRTLPLILASPIVGYGADNFTLAFPQNEYVTKFQLYDTPNILVDKAHSVPLQLTMNFGIIGAILLFALIGYSVKMLYVSKNDPQYAMNIVCILCIFGYLGAGLFYDSNLHVSPFFWTFVGFGFKDLFKA